MIRDLNKRNPVTGIPWERQPNEGAKAFQHFIRYRDLGKGRTLRQAALECGKAHVSFEQYSMIWNWVERCQLWDDEVDRRKQDAFLNEIDEMGRRHAKKSIKFQDALFMPVDAFLDRIKSDKTGTLKDFGGAKDMPFDKLFGLLIKVAQVFPDIINIERKAKGEPSEISKMAIDHTTGGEKIHVILPPISQQPLSSETSEEVPIDEV